MGHIIHTHTIILSNGIQFDITFDSTHTSIDCVFYELTGRTVARIRRDHIIAEMEPTEGRMTRGEFINHVLAACDCEFRDGKEWFELSKLIECADNLYFNK